MLPPAKCKRYAISGSRDKLVTRAVHVKLLLFRYRN